MKAKMLHWNPDSTKGKTACGLKLEKLAWVPDPIDSSCNNCRRVANKQGRLV